MPFILQAEQKLVYIALFKLGKDPPLRKKWLKVVKRYRRTGGADKFSKTKKAMVCEFHFNPKQIRVSLEIDRMTYLPGNVPSVFEFKPEEKKKKENLPNHVIIKKHLVNLKLNLNPLILNVLVTHQVLLLISQKT